MQYSLSAQFRQLSGPIAVLLIAERPELYRGNSRPGPASIGRRRSVRPGSPDPIGRSDRGGSRPVGTNRSAPQGVPALVWRTVEGVGMATGNAWLPPRWFIVTFWHVHRQIVRASRGRKGLWPPRGDKWGALRLTTRGRRSGLPRSVIIAYFKDGENLISMAMNGWGAPEPAWWLNLQAHPEAVVELAGGIRREVLGRAAVSDERERFWQRWRDLDENLEGYAARRPQQTAVVVLEPHPVGTGDALHAES